MAASDCLISAADLAARLASLRVLDARSGESGRQGYRRSHLVGALHADLDRDLAARSPRPEQGGRHPLPALDDFARRLGEWGIAPATMVAVYDDQGGANAAARAWWMLRSVGHARVAVIDGGWDAILAAELPVTAERSVVTPLPPYPVQPWQWPTADAEAVERRRGDRDWLVIDVRDPTRFRGEHEPYDPVPGHIPGAVNLPYRDQLDASGRMLPPAVLRERFATALGPTPPARVIVHCGSGVTACHTLLAMTHAGLPPAVLYAGSWSEWCRSDRPKAAGPG